MRHLVTLILASIMILPLGIPTAAQDDEPPNPFVLILDAFETPEGTEFTARVTRQPNEGSGTISDPLADFVHSTGEEPGFTPDHVDIINTWALLLDTGPLDMFTSTDASEFWAPTGHRAVESPEHDTFHTFSGEQVHDGSQYEEGALLFGFTLAATPTIDAPGRCEYIVWINDLERGPTFVNNPNFPADPAAGTNVAFGLGLNPADGSGLQSGFAIALGESGAFAPVFETDIRAFITERYVGITVPRTQLGLLGAINFYSFCAEEGIAFEPDVSGADQTGLSEITPADLGVVLIEATPGEVVTTTSTATTTTKPPETAPESMTEPEQSGVDRPGAIFPWWYLSIGGGVALLLAGWWLFTRMADPCAKLLDELTAARQACEEARAIIEKRARDFEDAESEMERLEERHRELCHAWPPACWATDEGDWIEDRHGNRITSRDIHMRKVALGDVWTEYKAGKLTAGEVEARWRELDTPEFRQEMRKKDAAYRRQLERIETAKSRTAELVGEARRLLEVARAEAREACAAADRFQEAYDECIDGADLADERSER